jgi:hypothetical protein
MNAEAIIRTRAKEQNDRKYSGREVIVGYVFARADRLGSFLSRDENLSVKTLSGMQTTLKVGDMAK